MTDSDTSGRGGIHPTSLSHHRRPALTATSRQISRLHDDTTTTQDGCQVPEATKARGPTRFMVRKREAIDQLLRIVAVAYALIVATQCLARLAKLRQPALVAT